MFDVSVFVQLSIEFFISLWLSHTGGGGGGGEGGDGFFPIHQWDAPAWHGLRLYLTLFQII